MVLVDTSIWIRFLANRAPYAEELARLLGLDEVAGHELVYGELLIGDRGSRGKLLAAYERMPQADVVPHDDVVAFVRHRDLHGRGVGWIDIHLLASAIVGRLKLWTADPRFSVVATDLGVSYQYSRYAIPKTINATSSIQARPPPYPSAIEP
jgi:predicted nucleic acid-binding protein